MTATTHNPFDESHAGVLLEGKPHEQFLWGGAGDRAATAPHQSLTRQTFHKILKSGCRAEQAKLRTAERLVNLLAIFCILGWRIFWLTMLHRSTLKAKPTLAFTPLEVELLQRLAARRSGPSRASPSLQSSLLQLACLGGYLNRATDGPPGNTVLWRGMTRLADIAIGFELATKDVGN